MLAMTNNGGNQMNVFILDRSMEKSAQMLDDAHLKAQINEACQILMANYNHERYPDAKIGHVHHPVTKYYASTDFLLGVSRYHSDYEIISFAQKFTGLSFRAIENLSSMDESMKNCINSLLEEYKNDH